MSKGVILLTGGNGMIGFKTHVLAPEHGCSVIAAVRSEAKKESILNSSSVKGLNPGSELSFVLIEDLATPGAYDLPVQGVDYIIHLASSMAMKGDISPAEYPKFFVDTSITGVTSILSAATLSPSVKWIIFASSTSAMPPWSAFSTGSSETFNKDSRHLFPEGPYENDFQACNAGKIAALEVTKT